MFMCEGVRICFSFTRCLRSVMDSSSNFLPSLPRLATSICKM
uniref:Uncharacterized protein n=2 Tax=unclassified Caudoviricetes TaxID=2788787 RepID=A0A8S5VAY6_9CAUD|nr:MAG TPA: hypothetical protein [Siphoviridae sp. ctfrT39]DAG03938.1 MAG TPA: hypothetical protein [Siphoviridae sp. ct0vA12]